PVRTPEPAHNGSAMATETKRDTPRPGAEPDTPRPGAEPQTSRPSEPQPSRPDPTTSLTQLSGGTPAHWGLGDGQAIPWDYAPAPEARDLVRLKERYGLFIGGREVEAADGGTFLSVDPATEQPLAAVAKATPRDVDRAVRAARRAQRNWAALPGKERAKYLFRIARLVQERSRELAVLESMDSGKPIRESRDVDLPLVAAHFWYYAGWADKLEYAFPGRVARPIGVAGQVIPWNFPLLMLAWKIAPALAAGNTVVLKPASTTPLSALFFADICRQADLPPGVVNIVPGPAEIGSYLVGHPGIDKVAFTGSTEVGKLIAKAVAGTDKALTLELGGKAANIVFEDAALDQAVEGIVNGIYFNQGEVCCAGSRLLVQESIVDVVVDKLKDRLATLRVGDPLDKNTDVGAINSKAQLEKITALVEAGVAEGAELYQPACDLPERGYFFRPTLFTNVAQSHRIAREEIFGPVLSVLTFRTPDEAVEKANNTFYGLSAGVWTEKGSRILAIVRRLRAGVVWANTFNKFDPTAPFGGYKESGFGREGGVHGLHAYVRLEDR
ncbi:MAG TPA: aldehyde dehydrogenase family protein, partial [Candidatus Limnocylindrales bacterium]|nr:aldehyde dehydrogenase family protein [Candidatus Limnocylindrales bacterium]